MSSRTPRGKPLKPVDLISRSGPTITAPTRRPLSLLQWAIWWASNMKRWSQLLENIRASSFNGLPRGFTITQVTDW